MVDGLYLRREGASSFAVRHPAIQYIPLDGSRAVEGPAIDISPADANGSLGLRGSDLYTCNGAVTRISLLDGHSETTDVPCASVTADKNGIAVLATVGGSLDRYVDHDSLLAHRVAERFQLPHASRIAFGSGGELIAAWHSDHQLSFGPLGATMTTIELGGYDGWLMGLDRISNGRFVIGTWFSEHQLRVFDKNGKLEQSIELPDGVTMVDGIVCGSGAELAASLCDAHAQAPPR